MARKKSNPLLKVTREELGMALHTALRKACDSSVTSLAWNLVQLDELDPAWNTYLDMAWAGLGAAKNKNEVLSALAKAGRELPSKDFAHACLSIVLRMFDADDMEGFAAYLT